MKYLKRVLLTLPVLLFVSFGAVADVQQDIATTVEGKLESLLSVISNEPTDSDLDTALRETIDVESITKGVLGKYKDTLTAPQTARFQGEFERSMKNVLVTGLTSIGEFELSIDKVKMKGDDRAQVFAVVRSKESGKFEIVSSIGLVAEQWLVKNLIVNGVNLGLTYRNQFNDLMTKHGDADKAIDAWAELVEASLEE